MELDIAQTLEQIQQRMAQAAQKSGRKPENIKLIGASKRVDPSRLREAWSAGLKFFGENRVQELKAKAPLLPDSVEWHFIGGIQSNKIKDIVPLAEWIHSVDRLSLVSEIENRASLIGKTQKVLVEVNVAGEASKHGAKPDEAEPLVLALNDSPHIEVIGFMCVPPFFEEVEKVRPFFQKLRALRDTIEKNTGFFLPELSMGMSDDFEIAIEEGATVIRVGTALFGKREKGTKSGEEDT